MATHSTMAGLDQPSELQTESRDTITTVVVPVDQDHNTPQTLPEPASRKGKNRQRLLRGIQRISPSPSFTNLRRARSHSAPYRSSTRSNLSCVSLAATGPATPSPARAGTPVPSPLGPQTASSSRYDGSTTEFPFFDHNATSFPVRRAETPNPASANGTAVLPADVKISRTELLSRTRTTSAATQRDPFPMRS
jgi:F-box/leucine-rich repeat protein 2/20